MNRWEQGRSVIVRLLEDKRLERVAPSSDHATFLVASARRHLTSAHTIRETDPELGLAAAYDACRKALAAVLAVQGLRPTSTGGHVAVIDAVRAQLDPPLGADISRVGVLRRERNRSEYPNPDSLPPDAHDVAEAILLGESIIDMVERVLPALPPFGAV